MPVFPPAEARSWGPIFADEFTNAQAPYLGINIFTVSIQNWEAVCRNVRQQVELVNQLGGKSHLWSVRDHGLQKKVLWINRYPQKIKDLFAVIGDFVNGAIWKEFFELVDSYNWFIVTEQPKAEP